MASKVLVISAGFDFLLNEMSHVWQTLSDRFDVQVRVVAPALDRLKGRQAQTQRQTVRGVTVDWVAQDFPLQASTEITALLADWQPDVVFAGPREHLSLARSLAQAQGCPVVLHTEYFFTDARWLRRRDYLGLRPLRPWVAHWLRQRVRQQARVVCISDPQEQAALHGQPGLAYLPWPHLFDDAAEPLPQGQRDGDTLIHVGSLFAAKGAQRLGRFHAAALRKWPDMKLHWIGPVLDAAGQQALDAVRAVDAQRVQWQASVPRAEAQAVIGSAFCVFAPGDGMGWGQIGDAWAAGTPVVAAATHYDLQPGKNCLVADSEEAFLQVVHTLRQDASLRHMMAQAGRQTVRTHAVPVVAERLMQALQEAQHAQ